MTIEKYQTENDRDESRYTFTSVGKETIEKIVVYQQFPPIKVAELGLNEQLEVYNLAFGDRITGTDDFTDESISNNGDSDKVLATVINTIFDFWKHNPNTLVWFEGSDPEDQNGIKKGLRTRLYQRKIERFIGDIEEEVYILGKYNNQLEEFVKGKKYDAFLIIRKS
jgi:hypothetical protein